MRRISTGRSVKEAIVADVDGNAKVAPRMMMICLLHRRPKCQGKAERIAPSRQQALV